MKLIFRNRWKLIDPVAVRVVIKFLIERTIEKILLPVVSRDEDARDIIKIAITNY